MKKNLSLDLQLKKLEELSTKLRIQLYQIAKGVLRQNTFACYKYLGSIFFMSYKVAQHTLAALS